MDTASYGYTRSLGSISFEEAEKRVREALASEGFGILTEIDVKETLKKKLGVELPRYKSWAPAIRRSPTAPCRASRSSACSCPATWWCARSRAR